MTEENIDIVEKTNNECDDVISGRITKSFKIPLFYLDEKAKKVQEKLDEFAMEFLNSRTDRNHIFHQTIIKSDTVPILQAIFANQEMRMKMSWAKYRYYHPEEQPQQPTINIGFAANTIVNDTIPIYE